VRRRPTCLALALTALLALPGLAHAKPYWLDTYDAHKDAHAGPVKTLELTRGIPYVATVQGTFSFFDRSTWKDKTEFCGTTERRPLYPSPHRPNGRVNGDAMLLFANTSARCAKFPSPYTATTFEIAVAKKFRQLTPLGGEPSVPAADHRYRFALLGAGKVARFRLYDQFTLDNYGRLRIVIRRARARACTGTGYLAWGFTSEAACMAAVAKGS
jgi:hypothetical protein